MNRLTFVFGIVLGMASLVRGEIRMQQVEYKDGDTLCEGYLAYDDATQDIRPAVLVIPEWWGLTEFTKNRADALAKMGYVAFVADIYGKAQQTEDPKQAGMWATPFLTDRMAYRKRAGAALETLVEQKYVDKTRVAAIGYCFGGTGVLELARQGAPLVGVISFHGGVARTADEGPDHISAKILICHGAADPHVSPESLASFESEMIAEKANYQINIYGGAMHAFTNPAADSHHLPGIAYNEQADHRSWAAARDFFQEIFK